MSTLRTGWVLLAAVKPAKRKEASVSGAVTLEPICEVILHNDDHNSMEHVVESLMRVFGHTLEIASRIMLEAHHRGKAIAEVEGESEARRHCDQLNSLGLTATVGRV